jgi:phosphoesterase RecJ-like protein
MSLDWTPFVEAVRRNQRFLLTTHIRPDGDGLGSMKALAEILDRQGKEVHLVIASSMPGRYRFLDPEGQIGQFSQLDEHGRNPQIAFILDTGTWNQLGDSAAFFRALPAKKFVIDHHLTQDDLGAVRLVDASAEATGRLVYEAIVALGAPLTKCAADMLFVAIAMDTGWFRHSNATPAVFSLAEKLVRAGAQPHRLYDQLFEENSLPRLKLMGMVLERLQVVCAGQVAHSEVRLADYGRSGAKPQDTEDFVNLTRSISGVEVGLLFMEQPRGGIKVSFRSRSRVDVSRVAEQFGGGGHRLASGATLTDATLEKARELVLQAVAVELERSR